MDYQDPNEMNSWEFDDDLDFIIEEKMEEIAESLLKGYVTDDNPSPLNGFTGLEQLILFEMGEDLPEELPLYIVKAQIKITAWTMTQDDEFDEEEEYDPIGLDFDVDDETIEEEIEETIKEITNHLALENITHDNPSQENGYTGLTQVVLHELDAYVRAGFTSFPEIAEKISQRLIILNGGCNLANVPRYRRAD